MKNIITALVCLFCSVYSFGQCDYSLKMIDSYGDGWNGNTIDVLVDGTVVLDNVTLASGSEEIINFQVSTGSDVTTIWNAGGSWGSETSYEILDNSGATVGGGAQSDITTGTISAVCPIVECNYSLKMIDSYGDGWNGNTIDVLVDGTVVLDDITMATGSEEIVSFTVADGSDVTTIWNGGGSWVNETSYEILDTAGAVAGAGAQSDITSGSIIAICPSCSAPTDLQATATSFTEATLSWTGSDSAVGYEIIVQLAGTGAPSSSGTVLTETTYNATDLTPEETYEFYVLTDCGNGSQSTWAGPFEFYMGYCDSVPSSNDGQGISTVLLGSTTFNSAGDVTYEDFTSPIVDVSQAILTNLQITFATGYTYDTNIWIDFNNDLVFDNDTELVFDGVSTNANPTTLDASFTIPNGTPNGIYNMRIGTADSGQSTPNPCYNGSWGVTVDMKINVTEPPSCIPPSNLDATPTSFYEATLNWTGDAGAVGYEVVVQAPGTGTPTSSGTSVSGTSYNATGLEENTSYEYYVLADCGSGSLSPWAGPFEFYMGYCDSEPSSNDGQGISSISLNSTSFTSAGDVTYEDFTSPIVDVSQALTADMQITFATGYTYDTNIWIDFNGDLVYDNDTELVYDGVSTNANPTTLDASFVIPADTPVGIYSMRIGTADSGQSTPNPCYNGSWGVTVDMKINVTEAPSCVPPSGLTAENITGTTADLSWNGDASNISWEYVIVLDGEPAPTGPGTGIGTTNVQATGLDYSTSYDLYVMALCGDTFGNSNWVGPYSFSTTQQVFYDIDCDAFEQVNIDYCYTNNDSTYWVFTSTTGYPLEISFNSGTIDSFGDSLLCYDGPDNTSPILFDSFAQNVDDFTGLVIESTSPVVYMEVSSDSFGSCDSSGYTPWDFDVTCKTCITQTVDFEIVGFCEPTQEFYVEANLTNMGDATSVVISDNQGSNPQTLTSTGMVSFGPFNANEQIVVTATNADDPTCSVDSGNITFLCPPPPNECSIIYAGEDTTFCSDNDPATTLTASYHVLGQDTSTYEVMPLDSCPMPELVGDVPTGLDIDDRWSEVIDLGFEFCFFGDTYSQILIGSNGVLSFEIENAGGYNGWSISSDDSIPNSTNGTLSDANIFGVSHDIDPSVCGDINYVVLGSAPARQFVVNYVEVCQFGFECNQNLTTTQIILYEGSNVIDVNIINKPACEDWNSGLAAVGVQNIDGTIGFTPPNRNVGVWEVLAENGESESWRFMPSAGDPDYAIEWYDEDNNSVGTGETVTVYPEETTEYTAAITYNLCNGETATATDKVLVEITPTPIPVAIEDNIFICEDEEITLEVNVEASQQSPSLVYYWTYDNIDIQFGPDNTFVLPAGTDQFGEYLVTAYNEETGCFADTTITVSQGFVPELEDGTSFTKCANGEVELNVNILNDTDLTNDYNYAWYMNGELLQEGASPVFVHGEDLSNGTVTVQVTEVLSMCSSETTMEVEYYMNQNCVDIPQGISPNGDGLNDCLVLDHLEDQEDIIKAEIYNRYGYKVFELNDYVDHWCGQDASNGNDSGELLPVGTYFYVIQYASGKEPTISWIYLNY